VSLGKPQGLAVILGWNEMPLKIHNYIQIHNHNNTAGLFLNTKVLERPPGACETHSWAISASSKGILNTNLSGEKSPVCDGSLEDPAQMLLEASTELSLGHANDHHLSV